MYYVSEQGDDRNPGTKNKPFKTIQRINRLDLQPGDKVFLKGGEVFKGTISLEVNGDSSNPIFISSYDNQKGNAIVDGGKKEAIRLSGKHFRIENLNVRGAGRKNGNTTNGISLQYASYGTLENIRTEGFQKSGLELNSCHQVTVKNVRALYNGYCGISITGTKENRSKQILVKDCTAENNPGDPTELSNHSGNGILVAWSEDVIIDHCTATKNGWDMPRKGNGPVGIWAYESNKVTIQYCISYRNKTAKGAKDGGGFDLDGGVTNSVVQYCLSYENAGSGYGLFQYRGASLMSNNIIRYSASINDAITTKGAGGIMVWSNSKDSSKLSDIIIHNNIVYSTHAPAVQFEPRSKNKNVLLLNNIFLGSGNIINGPSSGERFVGNIWWAIPKKDIRFRDYANLAEWSLATGQEREEGKLVGQQTDPLLKGSFSTRITNPYQLNSLIGYTLNPLSPLRNDPLSLTIYFFLICTVDPPPAPSCNCRLSFELTS